MLVPMYSFLEDLWWESLYVRHLGCLNSFRFRVFHAYSIKLETNGYSFSNASYSANSSYQLVKGKGIANLTSIVVCVVIFLITLKITQRRKNNKQKQATFRNIMNKVLNFGIAQFLEFLFSQLFIVKKWKMVLCILFDTSAHMNQLTASGHSIFSICQDLVCLWFILIRLEFIATIFICRLWVYFRIFKLRNL